MRTAEPIPGVQAYLAAAREGNYLLLRTVADLVKDFGLTPKQAGQAIAADIREQVGGHHG